MLKSEVSSHIAVTFLYFLVISLLRWQFDLNLVWLWMGALLGTFLLDLDHLIYWFYAHPEAEDSKYAKVLARTGNYKGLYSLLVRYHQTHNRLIFHSVLFQVILLIVAFYVLTAGGSLLGSALVLSMNLHLLKDEWFDYLGKRKEELTDWLFWQVREIPVSKYLNVYLVVVTLVFLLLSALII
jgi:hypothetical protein